VNDGGATVTTMFFNNHLIAVSGVVIAPTLMVIAIDADTHADRTRTNVNAISMSGHRERHASCR